jgi:hypothetical protein
MNENYVKLRLLSVAPEAGQLRPKYVGLCHYISIKEFYTYLHTAAIFIL